MFPPWSSDCFHFFHELNYLVYFISLIIFNIESVYCLTWACEAHLVFLCDIKLHSQRWTHRNDGKTTNKTTRLLKKTNKLKFPLIFLQLFAHSEEKSHYGSLLKLSTDMLQIKTWKKEKKKKSTWTLLFFYLFLRYINKTCIIYK